MSTTDTRFDAVLKLAALHPNRRTFIRSLVGLGLTAILPLKAAAQDDACDPNDPLCAEDADINTDNESWRLDLGTTPGTNGCPTLSQVQAAVHEDLEHISGCLFGKRTPGHPFVITLDKDYLFTLDHGADNWMIPGNGKNAKTEAVSVYGRMAFDGVCSWKEHEEFYAKGHDITIVPYDPKDFSTCGSSSSTSSDTDEKVDIDATTNSSDTGDSTTLDADTLLKQLVPNATERSFVSVQKAGDGLLFEARDAQGKKVTVTVMSPGTEVGIDVWTGYNPPNGCTSTDSGDTRTLSCVKDVALSLDTWTVHAA